MYSQIKPPAIHDLTLDQLTLLAFTTGDTIGVGKTPITGTYVVRNGTRTSQREPTSDLFEIDYEQRVETLEITRIRIGTKYHGPLLSWEDGLGWRNLYGKGDHGKNAASGGTWSASAKFVYSTIKDALYDRDYIVGSKPNHRMERSRLIESQALLDELKAFADEWEKEDYAN